VVATDLAAAVVATDSTVLAADLAVAVVAADFGCS
jgi:hypothetical protein